MRRMSRSSYSTGLHMREILIRSLTCCIMYGGKRNQKEAFNLKRQGVRAGVPDLCLPVSRGKYHALYIELKVGNNKATEKQRKWIKRLREQGNLALVCYGWEEASAVLLKYIKLKADSEDEKL